MHKDKMSSCATFGILFLLLFSHPSLTAEPVSTTAPKDPTANSIAQRALNALGAAQIQANEGVIASGTLSLGGNKPATFPIVMKSRGTEQLRSELTTPKGTRITIINDGAGKIVQPDGTVRWLDTENTVSQRVTQIPALSLLAEYQLPTVSTQYMGTANVNGSTADVIALGVYSATKATSAQSESQLTQKLFYIDHSSSLILRMQEIHYSENGSDSDGVEIRYSDYRSVQGVMVPFDQQTYANGKLVFDFSVSNVSFGVTLPDSDFVL